MFDIRKYMYDVYTIGHNEGMDTGVAMNMFMANVRNVGTANFNDYGHVGLDYAAIRNEINEDNAFASDVYQLVNTSHYKELTTAFKAQDREAFDKAAYLPIPKRVFTIFSWGEKYIDFFNGATTD